MERKTITNMLLIIILVLSMIPIQINTVVADNNYIIDGDTVYIDDTNVYLSATPHTIMQDGWVEFQLISKQFSGNIDVAFGLDQDIMKPKTPQRWNGNNWIPLNKNIEKRNVDYQGFDTWYLIKEVNINQDTLYKIRVYIDIQFNTSGKYFFGVKRSIDNINQGYYIDPWWNSNWDYHVSITIDHNYIDSTLTNFPVKINITDTIADECDGGNSIRFLDLDNTTEYYYEIEKWVDNEDRIVFVNVTSVSSSSDTQFLMYYNNSAASDNQNNNSVWDSNYIGVYHMNDANGWIADSTGNQHGVPCGAGLPLSYRQTGHVGYAVDFNGNDEWVNITDSVYELNDDYTIEALVNLDVYDTKYRTAVWIGDQTDDVPYTQIYRNAKNEAHEGFWTYTNNGVATDRARSTVEGNDCTIGWFYLASPHEATVETILNTNGAVTSEGQTGVSVDFSTASNLSANIGGHPSNNNYRWEHLIDEVRISNIARSEAWLNATWHTFNTDALISFGSPIDQSDVEPPDYMNATQVNTGRIDLNWTQGGNSTHTVIERHTSASWERGSGTEVYNSTGLVYTDTYSGFECETVYYYQAWGYNSTLVTYSTSTTIVNNITCPGNPTGVTTVIYGNNLNITWTNHSQADNVALLRKLNSYPTSATDGTILQNNTLTYYNDSSFNTSLYYRLYTWNSTVHEHSDGVNAPYGSLTINAFDENTSNAIPHWDCFITDQTGDNTYESLDNSNPLLIDVNDIPYGDDTIIIINSTGYDCHWYNSKIFVMDLEPNIPYTLDAYLSRTNETELYFFYVTSELNEPVTDATMNIKRYINDSVGYGNASIILTDANGQASIYLIPNQIYLIVISKDGYLTETSTYIPDPDYYGPYYPQEFQLLFDDTEPDIIIFNDIIDFTASIDADGFINVTYHDQNSHTTDTTIQVFQYFNGTRSLNNTDTRTGDHSFTYSSSGYNTSMAHTIVLYLNHSDLGFEHVSIFLFPIVSTMVENTIENYWDNVFGSWDLGYARTFLVFVPCIFFLVVFGAAHVGLGVLVSGLYLGFTTQFLDITGGIEFVTLASLLAVAGIVMIIVKRGRHAL